MIITCPLPEATVVPVRIISPDVVTVTRTLPVVKAVTLFKLVRLPFCVVRSIPPLALVTPVISATQLPADTLPTVSPPPSENSTTPADVEAAANTFAIWLTAEFRLMFPAARTARSVAEINPDTVCVTLPVVACSRTVLAAFKADVMEMSPIETHASMLPPDVIPTTLAVKHPSSTTVPIENPSKSTNTTDPVPPFAAKTSTSLSPDVRSIPVAPRTPREAAMIEPTD